MARFAHDCMMELNEAVRELSVALGEDTCKLKMRAGLHSGQVTVSACYVASTQLTLLARLTRKYDAFPFELHFESTAGCLAGT